MTRLQLGYWQLPLSISMAVIAGAIFTACRPEPSPPPQPGAGCQPGVEPRSPAELKACLQNLKFDSALEVSDSQPLTVIGDLRGSPCPGDPKKTCRYGPLAKIEPVIGAHNYSEEDLREGRIIARLSIPSGEREGYEKFGLKPGQNTYWWVRTDSSGTRGTSIFITETRNGEIEPRPVQGGLERYKYEKGENLKRAIARWIWTLEDETSKGTCGAGTCKY
jgi:hypothetical protein